MRFTNYYLKQSQLQCSRGRWIAVALLAATATSSALDQSVPQDRPLPAPTEETPPAPEPSSKPETNDRPQNLSKEEINNRIETLSERQDELSAIIQDLTWKWADQEIVTFLEDIDYALLDARDAMEDGDLGGATVAAQNDAIEKIFQAAKKNQQQSESSGGKPDDTLGAMMDQLNYMTGKEANKAKKPGKEGEGGDQAGEGGGNGKETDAQRKDGLSEERMADTRTVPKSGGTAPAPIPSEYRQGIEALRDALAAE